MSARADAVRAARRTYEIGCGRLNVAELAAELAASGSSWFSDLDELAKVDPFEAGRLARAMLDHLSAHRPENPAPLSEGFVPTEPVRDPRR